MPQACCISDDESRDDRALVLAAIAAAVSSGPYGGGGSFQGECLMGPKAGSNIVRPLRQQISMLVGALFFVCRLLSRLLYHRLLRAKVIGTIELRPRSAKTGWPNKSLWPWSLRNFIMIVLEIFLLLARPPRQRSM